LDEDGFMDVDFALIGHQESWRAAADVLAVLRGPERMRLPDDEIRDILPWIPPRAVCHVEVGSVFDTKIGDTKIGGAKARGLYIDSFIPPDRLEAAYVHENIARVRAAAACAIRDGAKIVSLGGFSSILIEGNFDQLPERHATVFTTGNTLTVGFIVQGEPPQLNAADRRSDRRCWVRPRSLFSAPREARAAQRPQRGAATQARGRVASRWSSGGNRDRSTALFRRS